MLYTCFRNLAGFLLSLSLLFSCCGQSVQIVAEVKRENHVHLNIDIDSKDSVTQCIIYRSHIDLNPLAVLDMGGMPLTKTVLPVDKRQILYVDSLVAHNCSYYYYIEAVLSSEKKIPSLVQSVTISDILVPQYVKKKALLFIDKVHYFIELRFDDIAVKRYPVSLGGLPLNRKLCFDRQSTPEGIYKVAYFKPKSAFYKAIGVNYPNKVDYQRYNRAKKSKKLPGNGGKAPSIGGAIQIHGGGVYGNWTWGCIAMRNPDIDELFSLSAIKVGCPIYIVGKEVTRENIHLEK